MATAQGVAKNSLKEREQIRYITVDDLRKIMAKITDPEFHDLCMPFPPIWGSGPEKSFG